MRIKLLCNCGTKFTFDVEPVDGRMPTLALCPNCQVDCTEVADAYIATLLAAAPAAAAPPAPPPPAPAVPKISLSKSSAPSAPMPPPAPASAPAPSAPAPAAGGGSGLKVNRSSHAPPSPPSPPPAAASAAPETPAETAKPPGLSVTRKAVEPAHPEAQATPVAGPEVISEDDSFEARRAKRLAASHSKVAAGHHEWHKVLRVIKIAVAVLVAFAGFWGWYSFVGSVPKTYYTLPEGSGSGGTVAKLFGPDELVVADGSSIALHDLKAGQARWTLSTKQGDGDDGGGWGYYSRASFLHTTPTDIWAAQGGKLHQIDPASGKARKEVPLAGEVRDFAANDNNLVVVSANRGREYQVVVVNLATGEAKTETVETRPKKEVVAQAQDKSPRAPTAGALLKEELEGIDDRMLEAENMVFAAAGDHAIRMDLKLVKTNITRVKVMRDAPKKSKLNSNTSIMSNPLAIADDVFNDIKRSDGGQFSTVDESIYALSINRVLKGQSSTWTGEISGEPTLYTGKAVDVIAGYQEAIILGKDNKLIAQRRFEYPIGAMGGLSFRRQENAPFIETKDTLFFWDKGSLTAFDLPSGNKRWNYQLVGITSVVADEDGDVYVCGTTASADSIQYSEDINLEDRPRAAFVKLDGRSGKLDWESNTGSTDVYLTGKFLYTTRPAGSTLGMMAGNSSADRIYIHRINPRNGNVEWEIVHEGDIDQLDVLLNRLAIVSDGSVKVLKFLSL